EETGDELYVKEGQIFQESMKYKLINVFGLNWNYSELKRIMKLSFLGGGIHYGNPSTHGQEVAEDNVTEKKKVKDSMEANLGEKFNYNAWSIRDPWVKSISYESVLDYN
nr:hypothetical protein [Tanacetum cinerariifolium]